MKIRRVYLNAQTYIYILETEKGSLKVAAFSHEAKNAICIHIECVELKTKILKHCHLKNPKILIEDGFLLDTWDAKIAKL